MTANEQPTSLIPSLLVRDLEGTLRFYSALGFAETGRYPQQGDATWAEARRDGAIFQFYVDPPVGTPESPVCSGTFYVRANDVSALATQLQSDGFLLEWGPELMDYGLLEFGLRDPNGYFLAFFEPAD